MTSLEKDLRLLINNPKYSDIEILCEDEKKLYGCRAILSFERQISLLTINSSGMEIILKYFYVVSIKENSLTKDNIVEAYYDAVDYFQLSDLQRFYNEKLKKIF
ncbi:BTB/POZ protein [Rhizophagus irregularis DAOM 181602=DAOM 197198]|nr:BTB/POZ protein [Rhizophagus irregularis DAOM 181602=DAOM 197198]